MKLWHCYDTRSLRPLWALEEMALEYDVETLKFPPRTLQPEFLEINPQGTIPYFVDNEVTMTESTAICHYLAEKYHKHELMIAKDHPEYGNFLNFLYQSDSTFTFPQALVLRYNHIESEPRRLPQLVEDYSRFYHAKLRDITTHLEHRNYLCDERFTIADIAIGMALHFGEVIGLSDRYKPAVKEYLKRLQARPAFIKARAIGVDLNPYPELLK